MSETPTQDILGHCWHCGANLTRLDYGRETRCLACDKPTHCCYNCRHYAPGRANACMEPMVEPILDKEKGNFCELFEPADRPKSGEERTDADALRAAAQSLFGSD